MVNCKISVAVKFNFELHGFLVERGAGNASLEYKLLQQLAAIREDILYELFLDFRKAYDTLDRELCLDNLVEYGIRMRK